MYLYHLISIDLQLSRLFTVIPTHCKAYNWRTILLGSRGRYLRYLSSIGVRKVLVELALYNRTYYSY